MEYLKYLARNRKEIPSKLIKRHSSFDFTKLGVQGAYPKFEGEKIIEVNDETFGIVVYYERGFGGSEISCNILLTFNNKHEVESLFLNENCHVETYSPEQTCTTYNIVENNKIQIIHYNSKTEVVLDKEEYTISDTGRILKVN